ncbi:hypothetical protein GURASL_19140 [Geotalea uraniireducens]|uniref:DUF202 domain-containing protein n=1 Tax=Geotalea uraniireducens TaxID=351604 RepID=A0ABM8EKA4_9BACT|nr:DUF202 domain-containing protein [Geotalea uraniireducens]BDV42991.1 hypothetical protein GURASL_19140 [Geotalea uraniireducens]
MNEQTPAGDGRSENERLMAMEMNGRRLVYFAAERTLLTWVRIALTLMGFGFIIDRFSLVYQQAFMPTGLRWFGKTVPSWAGSGMVILGSAVSIVAAMSYFRFTLRYRRGDTMPGDGLLFGVMLAIVVAGLGLALVVFLFAAAV